MAGRLSWGCGPVYRDGWTHSDIVRWTPEQEHVGDITAGLPWEDSTFDYVVANHALQMIPWPLLVPTLTELRRVTKRDGVVRILVPDLMAAFDAYLARRPEHFVIDDAHESSIDGKLCMYLTQAGSTRSVFTGGWLVELCARAGFRASARSWFGETIYGPMASTELDSRPDESLIVEAVR